MPEPTTLTGALERALATDPARPVLTYRDEASGERTELSARTLDNWIAKTANLLVEEYDAGPGTRVAMALPLHWQAYVWALACWAVGATLVVGPDSRGDVLVTTSAGAQSAGGAVDVVVLALRPLAVPGPPPPAPWLDYDREVRGYGDTFAAPAPPGATVALEDPDGPVTADALLTRAQRTALRQELVPADRVLVTRPLTRTDAVTEGLAALLAGAALVLVGNPTGGYGVSVREEEQITAIQGDVKGTVGAAELPGVRSLPQ